MPEFSKQEHDPLVINTHNPHLRAYFESYEKGGRKYENGEEELDPVREEIMQYFTIPIDEQHMFIIDNDMVDTPRHRRAWTVLVREENGERKAFYADGRVGHAVLLRRLYNEHKVLPDDDKNTAYHGFLDDAGFEDMPTVQERLEKAGGPTTWFIRDTVSPS